MANSMNRNFDESEIVVLSKKYIDPKYWEDRRVSLHGGFGMHPSTSGTALLVRWLCDGEKSHFEGYMIDPEETRIWQEESRYGRNITPDPIECPKCGSHDNYDKEVFPPIHVCNNCQKEWREKVAK
jgi:hypothetical protein